MPALRAGPRRVPRVNERDSHARQLSLVGDELPQLEERPAGNFRALPLPEPFLNTLADALQIFQSNPALSACSGSNQFLADAVVGVRAEAPLLPTLTLE